MIEFLYSFCVFINICLAFFRDVYGLWRFDQYVLKIDYAVIISWLNSCCRW